MAQKPIVFLDTNVVNDGSITNLLGNRECLETLSGNASIFIPKVVLDELVKHKRRNFNKALTEVEKNPLLKMCDIDRSPVANLSFDSVMENLIENEKIPFVIWELANTAPLFDKAYELAIRNKAPFEAGSDKGFKDLCVVLTVDDYLERNPNERLVHFISNDGRAREYFSDSQRVKAYVDVKDFLSSQNVNEQPPRPSTNASQRANSISEKPDAPIPPKSILIDGLCSSRSFKSTHASIAAIKKAGVLFSEEEARKLLQAATENQQIRQILNSDDDVSDFFGKLFSEHHYSLSDDEYRRFVNATGSPSERLDADGNVTFSLSEKQKYSDFVDELISHIESRQYNSTIKTYYPEIEPELKRMVCLLELDKNAVRWGMVASLFVDGGVNASHAPVDVNLLKSFLSLMSLSNERKREAIMNAIESRLWPIDLDLPF